MEKQTNTIRNNPTPWLGLGLAAAFIAAPNNAVAKYALNEVDPVAFMLIRALIVVVFSLPFILLSIPKMNWRNLRFALISGWWLTVATISFTLAIEYGEASFVTVLDLAAPIVLVFLAAKLTSEKVNHKAFAGVSLAALGAFIIVFSPIALSGGLATQFYPISALCMLVNVFAFPLYIIYTKKANGDGMPLHANMGIAMMVVAVAGGLWYMLNPSDISATSTNALAAIAYSGIAVVFLARILDVISYKHLGSAVLSTLFYLEIFTALLFATFWLGERLAVTTLIGGAVIILGIYLTEHHKSLHFQHFHVHKRH